MTFDALRVSPMKLLHGQECFHFVLENAVLVVLTGSSSIGFIWEPPHTNGASLKNLLQSALSLLALAKANEIKIIGPTEMLKPCSQILPPYGPLKIVPKEGPIEVLFYPKINRTRIADYSKKLKSEPRLNQPTHPPRRIRVLIVDDSKTIRTLIKQILSTDERIEIIGDIGDPVEVLTFLKAHQPDVITLDIHMPKMDGITLLKKYITQYPIPTVMITSISLEEGPKVLNALEAGAVDYIKKPEMEELADASQMILDKVLSAAGSQVKVHSTPLSRREFSKIRLDTRSLIAIGASTGGTEALRVLLTQLPAEIPPILIVQHIPAGFSNAFASRLNQLCPFEVLEAKDHDEITKNRVLIAPGGKQMRAICRGQRWYVIIEDTPPVNRHKPSVDYLFESLMEYVFHSPIGIILTGMGGDGAKGLLGLKNKGWMTIAQNKESSVVFGMPSVAIELGAAQHICHISDIAGKICTLIPSSKSA